jgi:hypothetical protein
MIVRRLRGAVKPRRLLPYAQGEGVELRFIAKNPRWQEHDRLNQSEHAANSDTDQAKGEEEEPDDRKQNQRKNRERPREHKQNAPGYK